MASVLPRPLSVRGHAALLAVGLLALADCAGSTDARGSVGDAAIEAPAPPDASPDACVATGPFIATGAGRLVPEAAGPRSIGAPCAVGAQCASAICGASAGGACGVCLERRPLGARCDGPLQGCSPSAVCDAGRCRTTKKSLGETCGLYPKGGDRLDCDDDLYCARGSGENGVCVARASLGERCDYSVTCAFGTLCLREVCALPPPDECQDRLCEAGLACDTVDGAQVCVPTAVLSQGDRCGIVGGVAVTGTCAAGLICSSSEWPNGGGGPETVTTCLPLPRQGETCILDQCAEGLFCASQDQPCTGVTIRRCEPLRREGDACETATFGRDLTELYSTCAPGLECRAGRCAPACP
jgi:hypothetical protein